MASVFCLIDTRYLFVLLPFVRNYRVEIVNLLKGKCTRESRAPGYEAMENRVISGVTYSIGYFWSMLGFGVKSNTNKDWTKGEKTVSSYIEQAEAAIKVRGCQFCRCDRPASLVISVGIENSAARLLELNDLLHLPTFAQAKTHFKVYKNKLKKAESLLEEALVVTKEVHAVGVTCVYDMLATLAFRQGDIEKAEKILIQVIDKLNEKGFSPTHNTVVNYNLKLARIYSAMGRDTLAEEGFRTCLTTQKRKYSNGEKDEETALLWLNVLFWYGKFLTVHKRYAEAKQCFESAYTLSADLKSIDSQQAMVMLYHLGEVSYVSGMEDEALKYLMNGVILGRAINSKDVPSYCVKIGVVYFQKGVYDEAKKWADKAKKSAMSSENKQVKKEAEDLLKKIGKVQKQPEPKMRTTDPNST